MFALAGKNVFKHSVSLFLLICSISIGITYGDSNDVACSPEISTYEFITNQSNVVQTGGFAGVYETYPIEGNFQLCVDSNMEEAYFELVDANLLEQTGFLPTESLDELFNMAELKGIIFGDTVIVFWGEVSDNPETNVLITVVLSDDSAYIYGKTIPPACCDYFYFDLDAVAKRKYSSGTGEPNNPYQIATADDLITLGETPEDYDKNFILTADIDLDPNLSGGQIFTQAVIAPDSIQEFMFTGYFDGKGHTIANLTIDRNTTDYLGLFGRIGPEGWIHNLRLENTSVTGGNNASYLGGIAGYTESCSITNCYVTGSIITGNDAKYIGGLVGFAWFDTKITQCFTSCNIQGGYNSMSLGGMVGENASMLMNCYTDSNVIVGNDYINIGGLVGINKATIYYQQSSVSSIGRIIHCYSSGSVFGDGNGSNIGGLIGYSSDSFQTIVLNSFWVIESSGQSESAGGTGLTTAELKDANTLTAAGWDFAGERSNGTADLWHISEADEYPGLTVLSDEYQPHELSGAGTLNDPYLIATAEDLGAICHYDWSACYKLTSDINLSDISWTTPPISTFNGTFDGNDFTISGLTINGVADIGLFSILASNALIKNLGIEDVNIVNNVEFFTNCAGSLAGRNYGKIDNCHTSGSVTFDSIVGGLVGCNMKNDTISNSYYIGTVSGQDSAGGLAGLNSGIILNCYADIEVTGNGIGGLIGGNYGEISSCFSTGRVSGLNDNYYLGGLVAGNHGTISDSYSTADVSCQEYNVYLGGLVGWHGSGTIKNCFAAGIITNGSGEYPNNGGLVGEAALSPEEAKIINSFWDIETSGQDTSAGGIGLTTVEMQTESTFTDAGWDFIGETDNGSDDIWWIDEGNDYPRLWWEAVLSE